MVNQTTIEEKIEKLISLAGNQHKYQYFSLIIFVFVWMNCNFMPVILPYIERAPLVNYIDEKGIKYTNQILSNEICQKYKYEIVKIFKYSWLTEYNIECNQFDIGRIGSFTFFGSAMGGLVFTLITKYLTYKKILIASCFGLDVIIFICTIINSYDYFNILLICVAMAGCFGELLCYSSLVLAEETVSSEKRSIFSSTVNTGYALCGIVFSIVFLYVQIWRYVFYILIVSNTINCIIICIFIYDSPRVYIDKKDIKNTLEILKGIAAFNNKKQEFEDRIKSDEYQKIITDISKANSNDIKDSLNKEFELENLNNEKLINNNDGSDNNDKNKNSFSITFLFKYPSIRNKFIILCIFWMGTRAIFNGIGISSKTIPGNFYFNIIVLYIIEAISYYISGSIINIEKIGRKGSLWLYYIIIIFSFIFLAFASLNISTELILNLLARFCACGTEVIVYTYTLEVYPTLVRSAAFGINITFGNGGAIIAPMLLEYLPKWVFYMIFGCICVFNSFLLIFLPETVGKPMVETIEELNK